MHLKGIHHVSLNVKDVDVSRLFYVEQLGMEELERPDLGFPGLWLRSGNQEVHLLGIDSGSPPREQHFAFLVEDLDAALADLAAKGVSCSDPSDIGGVCRQAFTQDPSGNLIEFNERL
jgi:glyoxylase I family protein